MLRKGRNPDHSMRLFLHGGGRIASALSESGDFLGKVRRGVFVPYAAHDYNQYTEHMQIQFQTVGVTLTGVHTYRDPVAAVYEADAIVVGGGNSFRLLKVLQQMNLIEPIRTAVARGIPYWGSSAGANVACPTIRTTNDMPIVEPAGLSALGLVPFQINPHYSDESPVDEAIETRESRIREFLEENDVDVVGLRAETWLVGDGNKLTLRGRGDVVLFRREEPRQVFQPGEDLSFLWSESSRFDAPVQLSLERNRLSD